MPKEKYEIEVDGVPAQIEIREEETDYVYRYFVDRPSAGKATKIILDKFREELIEEVKISTKEFVDTKELDKVKERFKEKAKDLIKEELPSVSEKDRNILIGNLIHKMLGLGDIEIPLGDPHLEEIVVNSSEEPIWVYHREYGWLKTDLVLENDEQIYNYASSIGRKVGKQISTLNPLLDAHLPSGDRTNATIFPISTGGNTITIRKFARSPWTITDFINNNTITKDVAALIWLCIQYELNIMISGGTGSGKTSLLNVLTPFIPPNQRIVSIEDTREIKLPEFLHWVPLTTREKNPEGKGEVSMLNLLVNSLRMRPDRIIVGEIRKGKQAEVLFEAMHTGHSVYSTLHANTAEETVRRLSNPPINVPPTLIDAVDLNVVMFRDRRENIRKVMELAEVITEFRGEKSDVNTNVLYRWYSHKDEIQKESRSRKIFDKLGLHAGLEQEEAKQEIERRIDVLDWMIDKEVDQVDRVGKVIAEYYEDKDNVLDVVEKDNNPGKLLSR